MTCKPTLFTYDLDDLYRRDTRRIIFRLREINEGPYIDLTACSVKAEIRYNPAAPLLVELDVEVMDQVLTPGGISLVIHPQDYEAIPVGLRQVGGYDVQVTWPSGDQLTVVTGKVSVLDDYTHP